MKKTALGQMLSGADEQTSSKRVVMVFFVLLFAFVLLINLFTGKKLEEMYANQLFELVVLLVLAVLGDKIIDLFMVIRGQKVTTSTTTIAPPDSTVVTTNTTKEAGKDVVKTP